MSETGTSGPGQPIEHYPKADLSQIPMPKADAEGDVPSAAVSPATPPAPVRARPVADLQFVGGPLEATITLVHPFVWEGETVAIITVRPVPVGRLAATFEGLPSDYDLFDIYAVMTGLPAEVLRALPPPDGERVTGAGYDFLPLSVRGGSASS